MTKLEPGRKLDELIAVHVTNLPDIRWRNEKILGENRQVLEYGEEFMNGVSLQVPAYSLWIDSAYDIVEELLPRLDFDLQCSASDGDPIYVAGFNAYRSQGKTAPHAICLAALMAVGYDFES